MDYSKIKVLMLGWEFPPMVTGGLGPACYGLAKALASFTDLKIVLPRSDLNFKMKKVNIIGLNHLDFDENAGELVIPDFKTFLSTENITPEIEETPPEVRLSFNETKVNGEELNSLFGDPDSYGPNIMRKVQAYADVAEQLTELIEFDVIHAHDWITYPAGIRLKRKTGKPLLVHVHSLETDRAHPEARNKVYYIEREGMINADRVLPVSEYTKHSIADYYGIDATKIFPVYNAIDTTDAFREERSDDQKRVLFLGRITRQKGPKFLLETMVKLCKPMSGVKFCIAGTGDQLEALRLEVAQEGLSDNAEFTGFVKKDKVQALLASADAFFMPSVSEPFGLSALEAAQFSLPCVISKQSGVSEVLHNVLKADFWDTDKLANYLYAVLHYKGLRETMTRLTSIDIKNISWDNSAREVLKSYKHVLHREDEQEPVDEGVGL